MKGPGSLGKTLTLGFSVLALIAIAAGVTISGGPAYQRKIRLDELRLRRMQVLETGIQTFYENKRRLPLPAELPALREEADYSDAFRAENWQDPSDKGPKRTIGYRVTGVNTYQLCASFETESLQNTDPDAKGGFYRGAYRPLPNWTHPAGAYCLKLEATAPDR
ncbi:MAG: type II secretion system protein [Vampirovibrionales bacterium]|nr:type II secretion system protein [Vampirovibrionales bacterium]